MSPQEWSTLVAVMFIAFVVGIIIVLLVGP